LLGLKIEDNYDNYDITMYVYRANGIAIPRSVFDLYRLGKNINSIGGAQPGDLIIYCKNGIPEDVALYFGNYKVIQASKPDGIISIQNYSPLKVCGIRFINYIERRCGSGYNRCPAGQCCSKNGYCGYSPEYCSMNEGCQLSYGDCKCGGDHGNCKPGSCCSELGYCGKTAAYCSMDNGCQKTLGDCRCGPEFGKCQGDNCCSDLGYCGTTPAYCSLDEGCQSEFGRCDFKTITMTDEPTENMEDDLEENIF